MTRTIHCYKNRKQTNIHRSQRERSSALNLANQALRR